MKRLCILTPLCLMACVSEPVVSDFNGSSVKIIEEFGGTKPTAATVAEARYICGRVGKVAEPASVRTLPNYQTEYLFLCL